MATELLLNSKDMLDATDLHLLRMLMGRGRATWADLAVELDLTAPAAAQRVRRLEDRGVITGFVARVDPAAIAPVAAFLAVRAARPGADLPRKLQRMAEVQECHRVSGEEEFLLKVRCASGGRLERLVVQIENAGASVVRLSYVLSTHKETTELPLPNEEA